VLEIGCGPGQLARFLCDRGLRSYTGFDFSPRAIEMARAQGTGYPFTVDNALTTCLMLQPDYDLVICTEVLEHIEADLDIIDRIISRMSRASWSGMGRSLGQSR
jgi:2-polyprenyl-3-methyl-5-hydroxy-6-metoxy-1,4-benzoquinol methylase